MQLIQLLYGYKATQCLYVAAKLNIADYLVTGNKSIDELATLTNTKKEPLRRILRCLSTLGIFQLTNNDYVSLNETAHNMLTSNHDNSLKDFIILCGEELYQSAGHLLHTVKTGQPAFEHLHGMSHWEFLNKNPDKAKAFHDAMEKGSQRMLNDIIKHYDFSAHKTVIDIAGGKGHLLCEILLNYPEIIGTVFDLPYVEKLSNEFINQKSLTNRCKFVVGDFFDSIPTNADMYVLKVTLHDWNDERAKLILKNCFNAMHENSKLLIIEKVIEDNAFIESAVLGDINMLVTYAGKERTLLEFQQLLNDSGLRFMKKINTGTVFSIIEAEKA